MNSKLPSLASSLKIHKIRGCEVILDEDLAKTFTVTTGNLNKVIARNLDRFPTDFSFVLEKQEFSDLKFQNGISSSYGGRRKLPRVFTEHGAVMAATLLKSEKAAKMSVFVVRAFVEMRRELQGRAFTEKRLQRIEKILVDHDEGLRDLVEKIRPLLLAPLKEKRRIGFHAAADTPKSSENL